MFFFDSHLVPNSHAELVSASLNETLKQVQGDFWGTLQQILKQVQGDLRGSLPQTLKQVQGDFLLFLTHCQRISTLLPRAVG